jgi:hypothetical protein
MKSRNQSYKKSSFMDKREGRLMRVHRRSIDQREMRHEEVNKRRQIAQDMSPIHSRDPSRNASPAGTPGMNHVAFGKIVYLVLIEKAPSLHTRNVQFTNTSGCALSIGNVTA